MIAAVCLLCARLPLVDCLCACVLLPVSPCVFLPLLSCLLQVIAACYALSLDLRLQVLWSAKSAIIPGGYNVDVMCR